MAVCSNRMEKNYIWVLVDGSNNLAQERFAEEEGISIEDPKQNQTQMVGAESSLTKLISNKKSVSTHKETKTTKQHQPNQ